MALHWFPFYHGDFLSGTIRLSFHERGTYSLMLIAYYAIEGPFPLDMTETYRIIGCESDADRRSVEKLLQRKFVRTDSGYIHEKCEKVISSQQLAHKKRSEAASKRWSNAHAMHDAMHMQLELEPEPELKLEPKLEPKPQTPKPKPLATAKDSAAQNLAKATWEAYRSAFASRWGADPIRNARVNSQVKQVVAALGADAPNVAAYFVAHNERWYVAKRHPVGCLLKDAEGLHVQWATGVRATALEAKSAELVDSVYEQVRRVSARLEARKL